MIATRHMSRWSLLVWLLLSAPLLIAAEDKNTARGGSVAPDPIEVAIAAPKEKFDLLEPVPLRVEIKSNDPNTMYFPSRLSPRRQDFDVVVRQLSPDGRAVASRSTALADSRERGPLFFVGRNFIRQISAGERIVRDVYVNLYRDMTVPGEYEISVEVVHYARPPLGPDGADETLNPPRIVRTRPIRVVVRPEVAPGKPAKPVADDEEEDEMVQVEVEAAKASFEQSEPIPLRVTIKNRSERPTEIRRGPRPFDLKAFFLGDGDVANPVRNPDCPPTVAARGKDPGSPRFDEGTVEIAPGGQVVHNTVANLVRDMTRDGDYAIEVKLPYREVTAARGDGNPAAPRVARSNLHRLTVREPAATSRGLSGKGIGGGGAGL